MKLILVDMDGVMAYLDKGLHDILVKEYPEVPTIHPKDRTTFYPRDQYAEEYHDLIHQIMTAPGFIKNLEPINGALEALVELDKTKGVEVRICTAPLTAYENCVQEKYDWVDMHLKLDKNCEPWTKKIIMAKDKTPIHGEILIDDRPEVEGLMKPSWEHILFTQPYNAHVNDKKRLTWKEDYKSILKI